MQPCLPGACIRTIGHTNAKASCSLFGAASAMVEIRLWPLLLPPTALAMCQHRPAAAAGGLLPPPIGGAQRSHSREAATMQPSKQPHGAASVQANRHITVQLAKASRWRTAAAWVLRRACVRQHACAPCADCAPPLSQALP